MKYDDKVAAAKWLYRRCHINAYTEGETLLRVIEDALMAGMHRSKMDTTEEALSDWLTRVVKNENHKKEGAHARKLNNDTIGRESFLT